MRNRKESVSPAVRRRRRLCAVYDWVHALTIALVAIILVFTFFMRVVSVEGDSMLPTLEGEDRLLLTALVSDYERGDIVVVDRYTDAPLIKRVIAVAGDTVEIDSACRLYINGVLQREDYIMGYTVHRDMNGPAMVPEGCVFVMGDNRTVSKDSRMEEIGMVSCKDVVGKVLFRVWPFRSFGSVYAE